MVERPFPEPLSARRKGVTAAYAPGDLGLYAGTVLIWSTTWLALLGALLGFAGVALMFWPEIDIGELGSGPLIGLALGLCGCLSFSAGNMISARVQQQGVPVLSANAWGVTYGVLVNFLVALVARSDFIIEPTARYLISLLWLAIPGSALAFWMYLALLGRIGADRAAYTAVLSPVLALVVSTLVEDYRWSVYAIGGLALVAVGNILVLRRETR